MALHILLLTDRDWTHPQGGAIATNLHGQVSCWLGWGHRVTVITAAYPGAEAVSRPTDALVIHRMGSRVTVFPRAAWATWRGTGRDADVVLEVIDGVAFFTPLWRWLRVPRVALVHHVRQSRELGRRGRISAFLFERVPLRYMYKLRPVLTTSDAARDNLVALGVAPERIHVADLDAEAEQLRAGTGDREPTLLQAAAYGTPSAALAIGGLPESIADRQTVLLPEAPEQPPDAGRPADSTARANLDVLEKTAAGGHVRLRNLARESESGKAAGLAGATLANNAMQLAFTVVFVRLLGTSGYGSLAALVSAFLILLIGGQSVQAAAARELTLGRLGSNAQASATLRIWTARLLGLLVVVTVLSIVARVAISHLIGVTAHPWAAAAVLPAGALWMLLSLQRGALQGMRAFSPLGKSLVVEAALRIVFGLALVAVGLGVTGAFLGTPLAFAGTSAGLAVVLHRRLARVPGTPQTGPVRTLRSLIGQEWGPITGLLCLGVLQNVDVIMAKHTLGGHRAGSYAAAAVAAKSVLWVAIGLGLHLLPEATRRGAAGLDPKPVLYRAFGMLAVIATPALLIFAIFPHLLLSLAFGQAAADASGELLLLGVAMTLLAVAYLTVLYMIALGQAQFLWVLGALAVIEPFLLGAGDYSLFTFATIVLGVQCVVASAVLVLGLRARFRTVQA